MMLIRTFSGTDIILRKITRNQKDFQLNYLYCIFRFHNKNFQLQVMKTLKCLKCPFLRKIWEGGPENLTISYMGGGTGEKSPNRPSRNLRSAPYGPCAIPILGFGSPSLSPWLVLQSHTRPIKPHFSPLAHNILLFYLNIVGITFSLVPELANDFQRNRRG